MFKKIYSAMVMLVAGAMSLQGSFKINQAIEKPNATNIVQEVKDSPEPPDPMASMMHCGG